MIRIKFAVITAIIIAAAFTAMPLNMNTAYAQAAIPEKIKIGLSYGKNAANLFRLSSEKGLVLSKNENGKEIILLSEDSPNGITVRRDAYYNINGGKVSAINFVKAAIYEGDVAGPYHVQVGDTYPDMAAAKRAASQISSSAPSVFIVYEDGWRVWTQFFVDEGECNKQIEMLKKELGNLSFSIVQPDRKRIQILDGATGQVLLVVNSESPVIVNGKPDQSASTVIQYGNKKYRDSIILQSLQGSDICVVNELPFEQYLYGVVAPEMPSDWNMEALKAQAVAARNYALVTMGKHKEQGFDLCNTEDCQVYTGFSGEKERTNEAVNLTAGKLLYYNDQLVTTSYHSTSGGHTENSENIWTDTIPYIRGVDDKFSLGSPYDNWSNQVDRTCIKEKLLASKTDIGDILDIKPLETSEFGRVLKVEIDGTKGSVVFEKEKIRWVLGGSVLKSICYKVKTDADVYIKGADMEEPVLKRPSAIYAVAGSGTSRLASAGNKFAVKNYYNTASYSTVPNLYTFEGKGWGHGLGMSQYGAKGMAEAGYNYEQILEYYYTGTKVRSN